MTAMPYAVLFKGDGSETKPDLYIQELQKVGLDSVLIPVLHFEFTNLAKLLNEIQHPDDYSGIVFTSVRSVEAVYKSLLIDGSNSTEVLESWCLKQNFAVGDATSDAVKSILKLDCKGQEAGNNKALCEIILEFEPSIQKPLLYPCSNIRKESLPNILITSGIQVTEIMSYETTGHPLLQETLEALIKLKGIPEYLIFFSPSGVKFVLPVVITMFNVLDEFKFIAIGPSTEESLKVSGIQPWRVCKKPNPKSLCEALDLMLHRSIA